MIFDNKKRFWYLWLNMIKWKKKLTIKALKKKKKENQILIDFEKIDCEINFKRVI